MSRSWLVPEVVQTSAMDCGPAALKCLLAGHGIDVSYGRLREACQTDVDGTSIDVLEDVAVQLGLDAEQIMLPRDHLLLPESEALPALVVVRLPSGVTHFVVVWKRVGPWVQVMDPGAGRRWMRLSALLDETYEHMMPVPAEAFRDWAGSDEFQGALRRRVREIGMGGADRWIADASKDESPSSFAVLDAAVRLTALLVETDGIAPGSEAERLVDALLKQCAEEDPLTVIPMPFWTASPLEPDEDGEERVLLKGAVVVRVVGSGPAGDSASEDEAVLSPELVAALEERPTHPLRELVTMLYADGLLAPSLLILAMLLSAFGIVVEAMLFRGLLDLGQQLALASQRVIAVVALVVFMLAMLALEYPITGLMLRMGRKLEARLRLAFLEKIPRLNDRYFQSRLSSDMAERSHSIHSVRNLPVIATGLLRSSFTLLLTVAGIGWLDPASLPLAVTVAVISVGLPLVVQPLLNERDMRMRTHTGALSRFYLDALLGLVPIRAHGAERSIRREHEGLLVDWTHAGLSLQSAAVGVQGLLALVSTALSAWLLVSHLGRGGELGVVLLLVYWALSLPQHGQAVATAARQYPALRNLLLRLLEPLGAPEASVAEDDAEAFTAPPSLDFEGVTVRAAGHTILEGIDLAIEAGSQVAIVGKSGAGKSSLVGLLLGWHRPAAGQVMVDGVELDEARTDALRRATAWVDPATQLFNRSLFDNLRYGVGDEHDLALGTGLEAAELRAVVERLPEGLQTRLGESGALVSGGEGQRVRIGRALLRRRAHLVVLDEPFRALDRGKRRLLMDRVRRWWKGATMLCITHDVEQTLDFERVLVIEDGRIVEDGAPAELAEQPSRYRELIEAEREVRRGLWQSAAWRRLFLDRGGIDERAAQEAT